MHQKKKAKSLQCVRFRKKKKKKKREHDTPLEINSQRLEKKKEKKRNQQGKNSKLCFYFCYVSSHIQQRVVLPFKGFTKLKTKNNKLYM